MVQTEEKPRLRQDLQITSRQTPEGKVFVVKDPVSGCFYQFGEIEHTILRRFDGQASLAEIREQVAKELDCQLEAEMLEGFVKRLKMMGLIESADSQAATKAPKRLVRGSILYLRLAAFDPDHFFSCLTPHLKFFFSSEFVFISAAIILAALGITYSNWGEMRQGLGVLTHFQWLLVAWVLLLSVTTLHEFAHGLTCKYFGGSVHELGFLLIFFQPAFYCNVSDAWMFNEKSKRLWVTFAGGYFELFIWGLATLIWRATEPRTLINTLALLIVVTSGIKVIFNINPLIKLDGYYLLSDYLEAPNLRQRSFAYLGRCLRWCLRQSPRDVTEVSPREKRIYLAYGLLAGAYSYWLLSLVALQFGRYLVARYHAWGFLFFVTILGLMFRNPLKRLVTNPVAVLAPVLTLGSGPGRGRRAVVWLGGLSILLFLVPLPLKVGGEFKILPDWNADVCAEVEGLVQEVYVEEGQMVQRSQPLVKISDRDYRSKLEETRSLIVHQEAKLAELKRGPTPEEIALAERNLDTASTRQDFASTGYREAEQVRTASLERARSAVSEAQDRLRYARQDLVRFESLYKDGLVSLKKLDEAREEVDVNKKQLEQKISELQMLTADQLAKPRGDLALSAKEQASARAQLVKLLAGTRPEEIKAAQALLEGLKTQENFLEQQIRLCTLVSPVDGIVATHRPREKLGNYVRKGDLLVKVDEIRKVVAEITVPEGEVADVRVGQPVVLKARAYPRLDFAGRVASIAPVASDNPSLPGKQFLVSTNLENDASLLKSDMTGNAKIYCGRRNLAGLIARKLSQTFRVEFWSWW